MKRHGTEEHGPNCNQGHPERCAMPVRLQPRDRRKGPNLFQRLFGWLLIETCAGGMSKEKYLRGTEVKGERG